MPPTYYRRRAKRRAIAVCCTLIEPKAIFEESVPFLPKYKFDIFISYAHADGREWVDRFCADFVAELHSRLPGRDKPEIFLDKHDLRAGDHVNSVVAAGIKRS